eukprot:TRINITY_DN1290_c2_g6_i1.p1 TRINITY_DN1290_c2_g6~~TRINITY_DN1290_c2_g6_i1.p1  ORF type:complete len:583 (+),score=112.28 TRINITY_DN1290_c2_g6_i1:58-1749(+)
MSGIGGVRPATTQFNLLKCVQNGMEKITEEKGPKILLLDKDTQDALSMTCSFSDMLQKDLYLIDMLSSGKRQKQGHLKAIVFVRPTDGNIADLKSELKSPLYAEYHLYFTNIVSEDSLADIAKADEYEVVQKVHELFCDYFPLHSHAFTLDIDRPLVTGKDIGDASMRCVEGLQSILLSIRRKPTIRFQKNSEACRGIAEGLARKMKEEAVLFDFRKSDECTALIVDRSSDLITPLLTQWTYEAMVHEEFRICKAKARVPVESGKIEDMNLAPSFDSFWSENVHANWGDLCVAVKNIVESYKEKSSSAESKDSKTANLEDLKKFMDKIPELRKDSIAMGKHTSIAAELGRLIRTRKLLEVSSLEQDMVCSNTHKEHVERLYSLLDDERIAVTDLLRLVLLYTIRWEKSKDNQADKFKERLVARGLSSRHEKAFNQVLKYGGSHVNGGLIDDEKKLSNILRAAVKGMQDVENIYTQHDPNLKKIIQNAIKGKLSFESFPSVSTQQAQPVSPGKLKEFIIFLVGGVTYEETKIAATLMSEIPGLRIVIGGTDVLRTTDVIDVLSH